MDQQHQEDFEQQYEAMRDHSLRLEAIVQSLMEQLGTAGKAADDYGEKLERFSGDLAKPARPEDVAGMIQAVMEETRRVSERNRILETKLSESATEVSVLQNDLKTAREEAVTDALTGIANRKYFDMRLGKEVESHGRSGEALSLLMIDIDHFKKFNDTHGHRVGDEVLRVVGRTLKDTVKGRDVPARYGGEEFAVILPQTVIDNAASLADQLRRDLSSRQLKNKKTGASFGTITISVGVAQFRGDEALSDLMQRADEALYRAKHEGRNRVVAAKDDSAVSSGIVVSGETAPAGIAVN